MSGGSQIVLLAGPGASTHIVYHALRREFGDVHVILEAPQSRASLLRRRFRRLGPVRTLGQLGFLLLVAPYLHRRGAGRIAEIRREHSLLDAPIDGPMVHVPSVNSDEARRALRELAPAVVVVNGTRIIGRETLAAIAAPVINMHMGITPAYRGVHGGWWALAEGRPEHVGTTIHLVDRGIDTGEIVAQATFTVTARDSFATCPDLHLAAGVPMLLEAVRRALAGTLGTTAAPELPSRLRSHPTLLEYLVARVRRGAR